jgi:hypothetical protein
VQAAEVTLPFPPAHGSPRFHLNVGEEADAFIRETVAFLQETYPHPAWGMVAVEVVSDVGPGAKAAYRTLHWENGLTVYRLLIEQDEGMLNDLDDPMGLTRWVDLPHGTTATTKGDWLRHVIAHEAVGHMLGSFERTADPHRYEQRVADVASRAADDARARFGPDALDADSAGMELLQQAALDADVDPALVLGISTQAGRGPGEAVAEVAAMAAEQKWAERHGKPVPYEGSISAAGAAADLERITSDPLPQRGEMYRWLVRAREHPAGQAELRAILGRDPASLSEADLGRLAHSGLRSADAAVEAWLSEQERRVVQHGRAGRADDLEHFWFERFRVRAPSHKDIAQEIGPVRSRELHARIQQIQAGHQARSLRQRMLRHSPIDERGIKQLGRALARVASTAHEREQDGIAANRLIRETAVAANAELRALRERQAVPLADGVAVADRPPLISPANPSARDTPAKDLDLLSPAERGVVAEGLEKTAREVDQLAGGMKLYRSPSAVHLRAQGAEPDLGGELERLVEDASNRSQSIQRSVAPEGFRGIAP